MTILPKKKVNKDKEAKDGGELGLSHSHPPHLGHSSHASTSRPATAETSSRGGGLGRGRNSPPRWPTTGNLDESFNSHDPGGGDFSYQYQQPETSSAHNNNKRRHRSSPHRNIRKHRTHSHRDQQTPHASSSSASPSSHATTGSSSPTQEMDVMESYNSEDEHEMQNVQSWSEYDEEVERCFKRVLKEKRGFLIKDMSKDGSCLFRAVADQVYGDQEMHGTVRKNSLDYIAKNRDHFSQYITEDFNTYLRRKRRETCHGNHIEMQAISEMYNRAVEVFQYSTEPINTFSGAYKTDNDPIRVSYHRNMHYNSVIDPYKASIGVGLGLPEFHPGLADKKVLTDAVHKSEEMHIEQQMLEDKMRETDWEVTQETIEEQVARESYLQWLRDNESRAKRQSSRSASATCSTATASQSLLELSPPGGRSPENRSVRSPRSRSSQNSPNHLEIGDTVEGACKSPRPTERLTPVPGSSKLSLDNTVLETCTERTPSPPGAVGGEPEFAETASIMNQIPPDMLGLQQDWNEDNIIAQVIAQSQQEYLDSLKKCANKETTS